MQKGILLPFLMIAVLTLQAQVRTDSLKTIRKNINVIKAPVKNMPAQPASANVPPAQTKPATTPPQPTLTDADYFLAGATITVSTGNDNKEGNNSTAFFYVRPRKSNGAISFKLDDYANEIRVNQVTDLRLERATDLTAAQNSLSHFKQNGLSILIGYCNKHFCTDAWKINSVTVTLEFKDKNGNPAPSGYASKIISFPVSSGLLGFTAGCNPFWVTDGKTCGHSDQLQKMVLKTDEYFNPLPAKLISYFTDDVN